MAQTLCAAGIQKQLFLRTAQVHQVYVDLLLQTRGAAVVIGASHQCLAWHPLDHA